MRADLERNLASKIDASVVADILNTYEGMIQKLRAQDSEAVLTRAGKFVEHILRAIEFIRTGSAPKEIKSPSQTAKEIEKDPNLPESLRLLIPRIALAMIYEVRSKRGAVHVKGIDPRAIDADLATRSASWVIAELIRLYHVDDEATVQSEMASLIRATFPLLESIGGELLVSKKVPVKIELQLLLSHRGSEGATRRELGKMAKCDAPRVTEALKALSHDRHIHLTEDGRFFLTGSGEADLMQWLANHGSL